VRDRGRDFECSPRARSAADNRPVTPDMCEAAEEYSGDASALSNIDDPTHFSEPCIGPSLV
jgi:hypothetical protein